RANTGGRRVYYQEACIDRDAKIFPRVDVKYLESTHRGIAFPGVRQDLPRYGGLAKRGERGVAPLQPLEGTNQHPLRDIKVALPHQGINTSVLLVVSFGRQV